MPSHCDSGCCSELCFRGVTIAALLKIAENMQIDSFSMNPRLTNEMMAQHVLGKDLQSPLGLSFEGENGQVLATMPFENASQRFSAQNMSFMGF